MPLVEASLAAGIRSAMASALSDSESLVGSDLEAINAAAPAIVDNLASSCGAALMSYLNAMQDFTGDLVVPRTLEECKALFVELFQFRNYAGQDFPTIAQAAADAWWLSMFPFRFAVVIPPPAGLVEATSVSVAPTPLGDVAGAYATFDEDSFANTLAAAIHDGASTIQVTVAYTLAAPPNNPAVLVGGVL